MDFENIPQTAPTHGSQPGGNLKAMSQDAEITPVRSPAAERMRRHRERRRDGLRCLTIELRETEIDALIGKKGVARNDQDDIRDALYAHLERTLDEMP
jgi:hypothetical protein